VFKTIGVLSGGERNRYALARMLMQPSNFLLLDEPTNHLDIRAKDVLLRAIQDYTGTVVFVSHDRYFIDKLATRIIEVEAGQVHVFPGNYEDYNWRKQGQVPVAVSDTSTAISAPSDKQQQNESEPKQDRRLNPIKLRQMKERQDSIEQEVAKLEAEIADFETALSEFVNAEESQRIYELVNARRADLEALMDEWEQVSQAIEGNS
jgi:ATP-binding cassette subfamily F protein 3